MPQDTSGVLTSQFIILQDHRAVNVTLLVHAYRMGEVEA